MSSQIEEIENLLHEGTQLYLSDPARGKKKAEAALALAKKYHFQKLGAKAILLGLKCRVPFDDPSVLITEAAKLHKLFLSYNLQFETANTLQLTGYLYSVTGNEKESLKYYGRSLKIYRSLKDHRHITRVLISIAATNSSVGYYTEAIQSFYEALFEMNNFSDNSIESPLYSNLGATCCEVNEYDYALIFFKRALEGCKKVDDKIGMTLVYCNISLTYSYKNQHSKTLHYAKRALAFSQNGILTHRASAFISMAGALIMQGKYKEALSAIKEAGKVAKKLKQKAIYPQIHAVLSLLAYHKKDYSTAIIELQKALRYNVGINHTEIYQRLASSYKELGDLKNAHKYQALLLNLHQKNRSQGRLRAVIEIDNRLKSRNERKQYNSLQEQSNEQAAKISQLAIALMQKNDMLDKIYQEVKRFSRIPAKENESDKLLSLMQNVHGSDISSLQKDKNVLLDEMHSSFLRKLANKYSSLTPMELKITIFLRLGYSSKEIAKVLAISSRTVENHRAHLRKKLNLQQGNLKIFLQRFA